MHIASSITHNVDIASSRIHDAPKQLSPHAIVELLDMFPTCNSACLFIQMTRFVSYMCVCVCVLLCSLYNTNTTKQNKNHHICTKMISLFLQILYLYSLYERLIRCCMYKANDISTNLQSVQVSPRILFTTINIMPICTSLALFQG